MPRFEIYIQTVTEIVVHGSVVENTKEYICRALITVVDHLGSVSANLDNCIPNSNAYSEAELQINSLKQVSVVYAV